MTTVSVWILVIHISGKAYVGHIDNIATQDECLRVMKVLKADYQIYDRSYCMEVKKAVHGIKGAA
jgi:predicted DNA-binding helix-hairpin-helix protein